MKYIVAVSGGLDSVALLHMLQHARKQSHMLDLVVAHVDHGIRDDSDADAWHVAALARRYNLPFETTRLMLGHGASEQQARERRYQWLDGIKTKHAADGIVTAHHADDQLETIALNFHRGTGWRGLASLRSNTHMYRPLLGLTKAQLVRYALDNQLTWREDETNDDLRYTRNFIRHGLMPKLDAVTRQRLADLAAKQQVLREEIEREVQAALQAVSDGPGLVRHHLIMMPDTVALEILRAATKAVHEPFQLRRLLHFVKTGRQGSVINLGKGKNALLTRRHLMV